MRFLIASILGFVLPLAPGQVSDISGRPWDAVQGPGHRGIVLIFVGVSCPISNGYAPELQRIMADERDHGLEFRLVYPDDAVTAEAARQHMAAYGYHCEALLDPRHALADATAVTVTPTAVVVSEAGAILYRGRIDDRYVGVGRQRYGATTHDLRAALDAIVAGRAVAEPVTEAVGCPIE